jgi:excisionase family DNA binding protein
MVVSEMPSDSIVLKISEACTAARVGRTCLYEAISHGELRALKRGRSTLILRDDLVRWLERLPAVTPKAERR